LIGLRLAAIGGLHEPLAASPHAGRTAMSAADGFERGCEADRRYFHRFQHRRHRIRKAFDGEAFVLSRGAFTPEALASKPDDIGVFVVVHQIQPGVRVRALVLGDRDNGRDEIGEDEARHVFETAVAAMKEAAAS
jgi:hypothetical protein